MNADSVLFIGLVVAWFALRIATRAWLRRRLEAGTISPDAVLWIQAATFAVLPLFALVWRHEPSDIALFVALSAFLFLGQLVLMKVLIRLIQRRQ